MKVKKLYCKECNKKFFVDFSTYKRRGAKFCSLKCYGRFLSKTNIGSKVYNWKGRYISNGYVYIKVLNHPNSVRNRITEHRLVMEQKLNRHLRPFEIVHHINGNTIDNRIENLLLCKDTAQHQKNHTQIKRCCVCGQYIKECEYIDCDVCGSVFCPDCEEANLSEQGNGIDDIKSVCVSCVTEKVGA